MEKGRERIGEENNEEAGPDSVPEGNEMVDFVDFRNNHTGNSEPADDYEHHEEERGHLEEPRRRPDENFKTGGFMKEFYSDAFSFSKEHEALGDTDPRKHHPPSQEQAEDGSGGFQQMKSRSQAAMSSAQIIKYHNFVAKRAKKVFTTLLKGYS